MGLLGTLIVGLVGGHHITCRQIWGRRPEPLPPRCFLRCWSTTTLGLVTLFGVDKETPENLTGIFSHDMDVRRIGSRHVLNVNYRDAVSSCSASPTRSTSP